MSKPAWHRQLTVAGVNCCTAEPRKSTRFPGVVPAQCQCFAVDLNRNLRPCRFKTCRVGNGGRYLLDGVSGYLEHRSSTAEAGTASRAAAPAAEKPTNEICLGCHGNQDSRCLARTAACASWTWRKSGLKKRARQAPLRRVPQGNRTSAAPESRTPEESAACSAIRTCGKPPRKRRRPSIEKLGWWSRKSKSICIQFTLAPSREDQIKHQRNLLQPPRTALCLSKRR